MLDRSHFDRKESEMYQQMADVITATKKGIQKRYSNSQHFRSISRFLVHPRGDTNPQDGNTDTEHSLI